MLAVQRNSAATSRIASSNAQDTYKRLNRNTTLIQQGKRANTCITVLRQIVNMAVMFTFHLFFWVDDDVYEAFSRFGMH